MSLIRTMLLAGFLACLSATVVAATGYQGLLLEPEKNITPQQLLDHDGNAVMFPSANGKYQLVFFGYTSCPDVCPTTLHKVTQVIKSIPASNEVEFLFISIDSERDKPGLLKGYLNYFHPDIKGLSGDVHHIKLIENQFGILTRKFQGKSALAYKLEHSVFMYLLNRQGRLMLMYPGSASTTQIADDLNLLLGNKTISQR